MLVAATTSLGQGQVCNYRLNGLGSGVDCHTGAIVHLGSPATGTILDASSGSAGLLDLAYPIEAFGPLRLSTRFSKATVSKNGENQVTIRWENLGPSRSDATLPSGPVSAEVSIRAAHAGKSVILRCHVENKSNNPVPQVLFPDLWRLKPLAGIDQTQLRFARGVVQPFQIALRDTDSTRPFYEEH